MKFYFHVGATALAFFLLLSACQKPSERAGEKDLVSSQAPIESGSDAKPRSPWYVAATLGADYKAELATPIKVSMKVVKEADKSACVFDTDQPEFQEPSRWSPLPITLTTPKKGNGKLDPLFAQTLYFDAKHSEDKLIEFMIWFHHDNFYWKALWRIAPELIVDQGADKCRSRTEICDKLAYDDKNAKYVCAGSWDWLRALIAEPNAFKGLAGYTVIEHLRVEKYPSGSRKEVRANPFTKQEFENLLAAESP